MSTSNEKKFRMLLHKVGYLKLEIEDKKEQLDEHEKSFSSRYQPENEESEDVPDPDVAQQPQGSEPESSSEADNNDDAKPPESNEEAVDAANPDPETKRLWKLIATITHPDKTGNDAEMTDKYKRATAAYEEGRLEELLDIAVSLSIKIENPTDEMISALEARATRLAKELQKINDSVLWTWAAAPDDKKSVIEQALRSYRKKKKKSKSRK